jgi:hypothetical protein
VNGGAADWAPDVAGEQETLLTGLTHHRRGAGSIPPGRTPAQATEWLCAVCARRLASAACGFIGFTGDAVAPGGKLAD